uniref:PsbP C-terminal domain-containing protein n=1 Tax=uncultured Spirochaetales bacterium HF0500_06B09 TaxID=710994 RepID=E0XY99_9SPIR|nr:hypothetical protein [uncultured Spirochaetales bacterium HF0500_06B09]
MTSRSGWPAFRLFLVFVAVLFIVTCDRGIEVRSYREVTVAPTPVGTLFDSTESNADGRSVQNSTGWNWVTPSEWRDMPGDGLRLARFTLPEGGENTVVLLSGDAGGVEANVRRWIAQLGVELTQFEIQQFIDDAIQVQSDLGFSLLDFTSIVRSQGDTAFLVAIASVGDETMFVKAEASASELAKQKVAFISLLQSLKPAPSVSAYGN